MFSYCFFFKKQLSFASEDRSALLLDLFTCSQSSVDKNNLFEIGIAAGWKARKFRVRDEKNWLFLLNSFWVQKSEVSEVLVIKNVVIKLGAEEKIEHFRFKFMALSVQKIHWEHKTSLFTIRLFLHFVLYRATQHSTFLLRFENLNNWVTKQRV